jgi:hypothetical protein
MIVVIKGLTPISPEESGYRGKNDILCEGSAFRKGMALLLVSLTAEFTTELPKAKRIKVAEGSKRGCRKSGISDNFTIFAS